MTLMVTPFSLPPRAHFALPAILLVTLLAMPAVFAADASTPPATPAPTTGPKVILQEEFNEWIWRPISPGMMAGGRKALAEGKELGYDHRGPLYLVPQSFAALPAGRKLEGAQAWEGGTSLRMIGPWETGMHDRFAHLFAPGKTYGYEVALKGKGTFHLRAWMSGTDAAGAQKWLGFPNLIRQPVTDKWQLYRGTFRVPDYPDAKPFHPEPQNSAAMIVDPGDVIDVDALRIWEEP